MADSEKRRAASPTNQEDRIPNITEIMQDAQSRYANISHDANSAMFPSTHNGAENLHRWMTHRAADPSNERPWPHDLAALADLLERYQPRVKYPISFLRLMHSAPDATVTLGEAEQEVYGDDSPQDIMNLVKQVRFYIDHWHVRCRIEMKGIRFIRVDLAE